MSIEKWYGNDGVYHIRCYEEKDILLSGTDIGEYIEVGGGSIVTVKAGAGKDTIFAANDSLLIYGEAGDDYVTGDDPVTVYGGDGNDSIDLFHYASVDGGSGNDTINAADYARVDGGTGDDVIKAQLNATVSGGEGNDSITVLAGSSVDGGSGNDTLKASSLASKYVTLFGGAGNDFIVIDTIDHGTAKGGAGDDTISVKGADQLILGDDGNDKIIYDCGSGMYANGVATIAGGKGNDSINFGHHENGSDIQSVLYQYHAHDGNDVIYGANCKGDVLEIDTNYTLSYTQDESQKQNNRADLILTMSDGSTVTFKDLYVDEYIEHPLQITGGSGGWGSSGYTYSGGSQTISDYTGEKVKWNADFTGLGFNNTDFLLYSSSGALTLQNVRDKVIDVADGNGNTVAYAFMASGGGTIDGSGFSPLEVILGGNNASNVIKAGSGGSSLWGGAGNTADTLSGGGGIDYFFVGKDDGSDVIQNASQNDRVMLYNTALSDIANAGTSSNSISLTFNTGATLVVNDKGGLSPTFQLADGSCWKFNHSTNNWESG